MSMLQPETIHNTEDLLVFHQACADRGRDLMRRKNHDYSGVVDVMQNFRMWEELGILVRAGDKLSRLKSYFEKGKFEVTDESVEDTALDLMNYAILLLAYGREVRTKQLRQSILGKGPEQGCTKKCFATLPFGVHYSNCAMFTHAKEDL